MPALRKLWQSACIALLVLLIAVVLLQVLTRYLSSFTLFSWVPLLPWTEEMSRFLFVAMVNLGMILVMADDGFVRLEFLAEFLKHKQAVRLRYFYLLFLQIIQLLFFVLFSIGSYHFMSVGFRGNSPSLQLPFWMIFAFLFVMSFFCCVEIVLSIAQLKRRN